MARYTIPAVLAALALASFGLPAGAVDDPALAAAHHIQERWDAIKFTVPEGDEQTSQMEALGAEADAAAVQFPDRPEVLIWDGILTSERASMAGPLKARGLAKKARDVLEKANAADPRILDAGAPTSLGVLYYRVPGFPIAFGDKTKARHLLEQATRSAPNGLDAWYFYGDFLVGQGEYAKAAEALRHARAIPPHPDRLVWDKNRRLVIDELLDKVGPHLAKS
jgi:tetratricopeptide (TPR) repeat protein